MRLLDGLLSWLRECLIWFDPPQEDDPLDQSPETVEPGARRKAFGELGLALWLARRSPTLSFDGRLDELGAAWVEMVERRNIFFDMDRRHCLFPLRLVAYASLRGLGHDAAGVERGLQRVLNRQFIDRRERSAREKLDLAYYLNSVGLSHSLPSSQQLLAESTLSALPELPYATNLDLYNLTHLIFALTDFGRDPAAVAPIPEVGDYAGAALAMSLAKQDWDLVAEIMAARLCAGHIPDALDDACALSLTEAQHPSGFIPGRMWVAAKVRGELDTDVFFDVYHPTLVCLILIACDTLYA